MIRLVFPDGDINIDQSIASKFKLIRMITDDCSAQEIPITNIDQETTSELVHYAKFGKFRVTDPKKLVDMAIAADYYDYEECMDAACKDIATFLNNKNPKFIRQFLGLVA